MRFDVEALRGFRVCDGIQGGTLAGFATPAPMVRRFGQTDLLLRPRHSECYRLLAKLLHPRKGSSLLRRHREVTVGQGHMEADVLAAHPTATRTPSLPSEAASLIPSYGLGGILLTPPPRRLPVPRRIGGWPAPRSDPAISVPGPPSGRRVFQQGFVPFDRLPGDEDDRGGVRSSSMELCDEPTSHLIVPHLLVPHRWPPGLPRVWELTS